MRAWAALTVLVIGVLMAAYGAYLIVYRFAIDDPRFGTIFDPNAAALGLLLLFAGVVSIGAAIDGIFTDRDYRPMGPWSLLFRSWRLIRERESDSDQEDVPNKIRLLRPSEEPEYANDRIDERDKTHDESD